MLQAMNDCCIVRQDPLKEVSDGGIVLPYRVQRQDINYAGEVLSVGPGRRDGDEIVPVTVKVGQKVMFNHYGLMNEVEENGEKLLLIREEHILAVIEPKETVKLD